MQMPALRSEIEKALDELASNEGGMSFQGLAVVLAKQRWPELIACERKNDLGLDAYASASLAPDKIGKGLACSITAKLDKISDDAKKARQHFNDLTVLIFATPQKVSNPKKQEWAAKIREEFGYELHVMSREDIITSLMIPENAALCRSCLAISLTIEPPVTEMIERIRRAASEVAANWTARTRGHPLVDLRAVRLDHGGADSADVFPLSRIQVALAESRRLVLEAPAGRGKTTTLIQLANQHIGTGGTAFLVDLPAWTASHLGILEFVAGMPSFQAHAIDAGTLARAQTAEHFSFLLNGWNEIAESNSIQAVEALRELERTFPAAGIIVATRTHHISPPLPGALRLRLLTLTRQQRTAYLRARLGDRSGELSSLMHADPVLDGLTRTPFILSEVTAIFEAGAPIPNTKIGVLDAVIRLLEQSPEHRNHLHVTPLFGSQHDYQGELATRMTTQGAVTVPEAEARAITQAVAARLRDSGQIASLPEPAAVLSALCAHHVLERIEYPAVAFRFEHQQFQEHYAALGIKRQLWQLIEGGRDAQRRQFTAEYVNEPAWAEPLRMIAETFGARADEATSQRTDVEAGRLLVEMALSVDPTFAAELARLSGGFVWKEVRGLLTGRLRSWYAVRDEHHRHCALAGMLASGSDDFSDIVAPLLAGENQQARLQTYRLWPEFHVTSLGPNWRELVSAWSEEARIDFVSELLHNRFVPEIPSFALADPSSKVQKAAVEGLAWIGSDDEAARLLERIDPQTFEAVAQAMPDLMPAAIRPRALAALQKLRDDSADPAYRLKILLTMAALGETNIASQLKDELNKLPSDEMEKLGHFAIRPTLDILRQREPEWVSHWVAARVANGSLWPDHWMMLVTIVPEDLTERLLQRLETEDFKHARFDGIISVLAASADDRLAARVFSKLCALRRTIVGAPGERHEFEWAIERQLEALFRALPVNVAVSGSSTSLSGGGDAIDVEVIAGLFSKVARSDSEPIADMDHDLKEALRAYLKKSMALVLRQDDFNGELKANLGSVIAQIGAPEDISDLVTLIQADIERVRRGRAARSSGDRGPLGNGGSISYAPWHVRAVAQLDSANTDAVLLGLLQEPEYEGSVAEELVRLAIPTKSEKPFGNKVDYKAIWEARAGRLPRSSNDERRNRYAAALREQIARLLEERPHSGQLRPHDYRLKELAKALAAIDGHGSAGLVLEVISVPGEWDGWQRVEAAERLLFSGVVLPTEPILALLDSTLERAQKYGLQDQDRWLVERFLCMCPFVDSPSKGIQKIRDVLAKNWLPPYELRDVATAVGQSRCDEALDFLRELASDERRAEQLDDAWTNAVGALDSPAARNLLLSFVDPAVPGLAVEVRLGRHDVLAARIVDLARRDPPIEARLRQLCELELPPLKRALLSKVISWLGTSEAISAGLNLIDDRVQPSVPWDTREQVEAAFVERRPYAQSQNTYTLAARSSNAIRGRLFEMAVIDERRKRSAFSLLGQIEEWRLEYGRPTGEPRHPAFDSGEPWPPREPHT